MPRLLLRIVVAILVGLVAGLIGGWQIGLTFAVIYFLLAWAARKGQRQKLELDAYREQWLNKRRTDNDGRPLRSSSQTFCCVPWY
jgi:membrane protein implicated in regulation of membrane protease activity